MDGNYKAAQNCCMATVEAIRAFTLAKKEYSPYNFAPEAKLAKSNGRDGQI
jgi:hypothetical protein